MANHSAAASSVACVDSDAGLHLHPREVGREISRVHPVILGIEKWLINAAALIRADAAIANAVLELHLKPPLPVPLAGLHDDAVEGIVELLDARPARINKRRAGEGGAVSRCLKGRISNVEIMAIIISRWRWAAGRALILLLIIDEKGGPNC